MPFVPLHQTSRKSSTQFRCSEIPSDHSPTSHAFFEIRVNILSIYHRGQVKPRQKCEIRQIPKTHLCSHLYTANRPIECQTYRIHTVLSRNVGKCSTENNTSLCRNVSHLFVPLSQSTPRPPSTIRKRPIGMSGHFSRYHSIS